MLLIILILIIIAFFIGFFSLRKAKKIAIIVENEQPSFLDLHDGFKKLTQVNKSQFIFYIVSGYYHQLHNSELVNQCKRIQRNFIGSFVMVFVLAISFIVIAHFILP